jgi:flagellar basal-body rod protein FlgC
MSSFKIFDIAGSGMAAQSVRLNTVASNLANAESVSGDPKLAYRARHPVFEAVRANVVAGQGKDIGAAVREGVVRAGSARGARCEPGNLANAEASSMRPTSMPWRRWST